jgi:hypothetical protein
MKKTSFQVFAGILLIFVVSTAQADSSFQILKIIPDSRYLGAGQTGTASADDSGSFFLNPAGLAGVERSEVLFSHVNYFNEMYYENISMAHAFDKNVVGLDIGFFSYGSIPNIDINGKDLGKVAPNDFFINAGFARSLITEMDLDLRAGASLRFINSTLASAGASALALDAGVQLGCMLLNYQGRIKPNFRIGASLRNAGLPLKNFESSSLLLPMQIRAGLGYDVFQYLKTHNVAVDIDYCENFDGRSLNGGLVYSFSGIIFVRGGYVLDFGESNSFPSAGLGIAYTFGNMTLLFNAAVVFHPSLGNSYQGNLGMRF